MNSVTLLSWDIKISSLFYWILKSFHNYPKLSKYWAIQALCGYKYNCPMLDQLSRHLKCAFLYIYDGVQYLTVHIGVKSTDYDWSIMHKYLILLLSRSRIIVKRTQRGTIIVKSRLIWCIYNGTIFVLTLLSERVNGDNKALLYIQGTNLTNGIDGLQSRDSGCRVKESSLADSNGLFLSNGLHLYRWFFLRWFFLRWFFLRWFSLCSFFLGSLIHRCLILHSLVLWCFLISSFFFRSWILRFFSLALFSFGFFPLILCKINIYVSIYLSDVCDAVVVYLTYGEKGIGLERP